jgi:hypothetical protein
MKLKSAGLYVDIGEDDCPLCRFDAGKRDFDTLLGLILFLDEKLYEQQKFNREVLFGGTTKRA